LYSPWCLPQRGLVSILRHRRPNRLRSSRDIRANAAESTPAALPDLGRSSEALRARSSYQTAKIVTLNRTREGKPGLRFRILQGICKQQSAPHQAARNTALLEAPPGRRGPHASAAPTTPPTPLSARRQDRSCCLAWRGISPSRSVVRRQTSGAHPQKNTKNAIDSPGR